MCVYAPSELVLEDASVPCRHWLGRILILVLVDGSTEAKGLDVRHKHWRLRKDSLTRGIAGCTPHGARSVFVMDTLAFDAPVTCLRVGVASPISAVPVLRNLFLLPAALELGGSTPMIQSGLKIVC